MERFGFQIFVLGVLSLSDLYTMKSVHCMTQLYVHKPTYFFLYICLFNDLCIYLLF